VPKTARLPNQRFSCLLAKTAPLLDRRKNTFVRFSLEHGADQLQNGGRNHGVTASSWVSHVRCGIDEHGRETRVPAGKAKTPSVAEIRRPTTPPIERWIDARRQLEVSENF
jgi:hypothetical protein